MKNRVLAVCLVTAVLLVISRPVFAHHSAAGLFSRKDQRSISGTVRKWLFVNPHAALVMDIKNAAGDVETWRIQFLSPPQLGRMFGWNRKSIKPGDQITILGNPYVDGKKVMFPLRVTFANGKVYTVREPEKDPE